METDQDLTTAMGVKTLSIHELFNKSTGLKKNEYTVRYSRICLR